MVVKPDDGPLCTCGKRGCVESLASGDAIGSRARERLTSDVTTPSSLREFAPDQLTGKAVGEAAVAGDALAQEVVTEAARWLGLGIAGVANVLDPDVVVVGGGVPEMGVPFMRPLEEAFRAYATPSVAKDTRLAPAQLGYDAGVIGAAAAAFVALGVLGPALNQEDVSDGGS